MSNKSRTCLAQQRMAKLRKLRLSRGGQLALQLAPAVIVLSLWQAAAVVNPGYDFTTGSPLGIAREFAALWAVGNLPLDFAITGVEAILGFLAGTVIGTSVGLAMWTSRIVFLIARPYLIALGAVPVFALGPALIFWFGTGIWSKVVLGFLSTFVIALVQAYTGATEADPNLLRLTEAFGGTRRQMFFKIIVPSATIWVLSGVRLNIGMALLGAFVAEFISSRMGLGHMIIIAEGLYNVNQIWVGVIGIMILAILFHSFTLPIERWANRWK
jgi:NitT/TauT family transport system permease protein